MQYIFLKLCAKLKFNHTFHILCWHVVVEAFCVTVAAIRDFLTPNKSQLDVK